MRHLLLTYCALSFATLAASAAHAQDPNRQRSPAQFPNPSAAANMRDSVVTRAVAPNNTAPNIESPANSPAQLRQPSAAAPLRLNEADHGASAQGNQPAFSDQAWTSQPSAGPAVRSASDASQLTRGQQPRSIDGGVIQAQFTANDPSMPALATQGNIQTANTGSSLSEPRPLKPQTASKPDAARSTGTAQMFISVISSLAIVIGLMFGAAWCYRKAAPAISGALPKTVVQVLGRTPLAPRQQLVLLRIGSKLVLVSNLHGEVRTISEITDPLEVDRLAGLCESAQPGSISESFRSVLHNIGRHES